MEKFLVSIIGIIVIGALVGSGAFALWVNIAFIVALILFLWKVWK